MLQCTSSTHCLRSTAPGASGVDSLCFGTNGLEETCNEAT
jgi:hypothetical protein